MTKDEIRTQFLNLRKALPDAEYDLLNHQLCDRFISAIDLSRINAVHIFLPIVSNKEPNTWLIVDRIQKEFSNTRISIPKMNSEGTLTNFYFEGKNQIKENQLRIPEPQFGEVTPVNEIDLVIVPLLAFDAEGHRVGYGKGFYDRFLKECKSDCKKIGLSFFDPVDKISDLTQHDVKLTQAITPKQVFTF